MIHARRDPAVAVVTATTCGGGRNMVHLLAGSTCTIVAANTVIARVSVVEVCR